MPLSPPANRTPVHTREITLNGYQRADGKFDIEASLADAKHYTFSMTDRGELPAGELVHGMTMRWTLDADLTILESEAVMDHTPFTICPEVAPNFSALAGLQIGRGFLRNAGERVAGTSGCTHLRELFQQMATVAIQTIMPLRARAGGTGLGKALINTCYAHAEDSPVTLRRFPELRKQPASE